MKHYCQMCGEQWNEDVCAACGWHEGKPARYSTKAKPPRRDCGDENMEVMTDPVLADPVSHGDLQAELSRLREAIVLLGSCVGPHIMSADNARRLLALVAPPHERIERMK